MRVCIHFKSPSESSERIEDLCSFDLDVPESTIEETTSRIKKDGFIMWGDEARSTRKAIPWHQIVQISQA